MIYHAPRAVPESLVTEPIKTYGAKLMNEYYQELIN
jgi:hypothetical protein